MNAECKMQNSEFKGVRSLARLGMTLAVLVSIFNFTFLIAIPAVHAVGVGSSCRQSNDADSCDAGLACCTASDCANAGTCMNVATCPDHSVEADRACSANSGQSSNASSTEEESAAKGLRGAFDIFNIAKEKAGFVGQQTSPEIVAGQIIQGLILVIGVIFGILIIYAGFLWMTARGNEEMVTKAISILQNSVIGFILVMAAYAITNFVVDRVIGAAFQ